MDIREKINNSLFLMDGAMGTQLAAIGAPVLENPALLNIEAPEYVERVHRSYIEAGCDAITVNTFTACAPRLEKTGVTSEEAVRAAVRCAANARGDRDVALFLDLGPSGLLMPPLGNASFDEVYDVYARMIKAAGGADGIIIETVGDLAEARAALIAAKEQSGLPVFVSMTFEENGVTFAGTTPESAALTLSALGADAVGVNCSLDPERYVDTVKRMARVSRVPLIAQPNAALPRPDGSYDSSPERFVAAMDSLIEAGARVIGGCCGTSPAYTALLRKRADRGAAPFEARFVSGVCSPESFVSFDRPVLAGERLNPTGKKKLKEALLAGDMAPVAGLAASQQADGAELIDINAGIAGADEVRLIADMTVCASASSSLPLMLDSRSPEALEAGLRCARGRCLINSATCAKESMDAIFPLAKKYGAAVVLLAMDENGIPKSAEERFSYIERGVAYAEKFGLRACDIVADCLTTAVSAGEYDARETLGAVRLVKRLGVSTMLGLSNISFGLPEREALNAAFTSLALSAGLDIALVNPSSERVRAAFYAGTLLAGRDAEAQRYLENCAPVVQSGEEQKPSLAGLIESGLCAQSAEETRSLLEAGEDAMDIVNAQLIPALDRVGEGFSSGRVFLPTLMRAATAAGAAFECIRAASASAAKARGSVVIATVEGDLHDIGKNIARLVMENYGYGVIDLGRSVPAARILEAAKEAKADLVGLSALMTTTLPAMEKTVRLLKEQGFCVLVAGAVVNEEYARGIGADYYAADATDNIRILKTILE